MNRQGVSAQKKKSCQRSCDLLQDFPVTYDMGINKGYSSKVTLTRSI